MLPGFIFGEGTSTPDAQSLQRRRQMVDQLLASSLPRAPQTFGEGLTAIGLALAGRMQDKRLREKEEAERQRVGGQFSQITGALLGGGQGAQSSPAPMAVNRPMVQDDASRMGGDMSKYRNAIASIESDGSGGYAAIGPTHSKLGRALGRYQVMEANIGPWSRAALGREVTPEEFLASPEIQDAIFDHRFGQYVRRHGPEAAAQAWFAGEGGIGQLDRRDSLGTTVGAYTDKFSRALGGSGQAASQAQAMGGIDPTVIQLAQLMQNPYLDPGQRMIAEQLVQQRMQAADPMRAMEMERAQLELERMRNPQPELTSAQREYEMARSQGFQGSFLDYQNALAEARRPQTNVNVNTGAEARPELLGTQGLVAIPDQSVPQGFRVEPAPGSPMAREQEQSQRQAQTQATNMLDVIDGILGDPALESATGFGKLLQSVPGTSTYRFGTRARQLEGQAFLQAFESLKGGGQITQIEGEKATQAIGRLDTAQNADDYRDALNELRGIVIGAYERAGGDASKYRKQTGEQNTDDLEALLQQDPTTMTLEELREYNRRLQELTK